MRQAALALGVLLFLAGAGSATAGDPAEGARLARQWCASCHVIDENQTSSSDAAPPFHDVANDPLTTEDGLRAWLSDPHPPMPPINLTRFEIENLVSYIQELAQD